MGKGDRKTRRGKIYRGSYGKVRPHSIRHDDGDGDRKPGVRPLRKTTRRRKPG